MTDKYKGRSDEYGIFEAIEDKFGFIIDSRKNGGMKVVCTKTGAKVKFSKKQKDEFLQELNERLNNGVKK